MLIDIHIYAEKEVEKGVWALHDETIMLSTVSTRWVLFGSINHGTLRGIPTNSALPVQHSQRKILLTPFHKPCRKYCSYAYISELKIAAATLLLSANSVKDTQCQESLNRILKLFPETIKNNYRIVYYYELEQ